MSYMKDRTTLQVPRPVLTRLRKFSRKGQTYGDTLNRLMDIAERERYIDEQLARARDKRHLLPESAIRWE